MILKFQDQYFQFNRNFKVIEQNERLYLIGELIVIDKIHCLTECEKINNCSLVAFDLANSCKFYTDLAFLYCKPSNDSDLYERVVNG